MSEYNPYAIYPVENLKRMFRFYRQGPRANKQARQSCRDIIKELRERSAAHVQ